MSLKNPLERKRMPKGIKKETSAQTKVSDITVSKTKVNVKVIVPLKDLVQAYIEAGDKIKELDKLAEPYKEAKDSIKQEIIRTFKDRGEFSSRIEGATVSLSVRKTAVVVDETEVIAYLLDNNMSEFTAVSLAPEFEAMKKAMASEEMDLLPGVEIKETEFISVRKNDKEDARKVTTEKFVKVGGPNG